MGRNCLLKNAAVSTGLAWNVFMARKARAVSSPARSVHKARHSRADNLRTA
jgi:hypothetical protein